MLEVGDTALTCLRYPVGRSGKPGGSDMKGEKRKFEGDKRPYRFCYRKTVGTILTHAPVLLVQAFLRQAGHVIAYQGEGA